MNAEYPHVLKWDRLGRRGQACRILTPATTVGKNVQVEFGDGVTAIVPRRAIRRQKTQSPNLVHGQNQDSPLI